MRPRKKALLIIESLEERQVLSSLSLLPVAPLAPIVQQSIAPVVDASSTSVVTSLLAPTPGMAPAGSLSVQGLLDTVLAPVNDVLTLPSSVPISTGTGQPSGSLGLLDTVLAPINNLDLLTPLSSPPATIATGPLSNGPGLQITLPLLGTQVSENVGQPSAQGILPGLGVTGISTPITTPTESSHATGDGSPTAIAQPNTAISNEAIARNATLANSEAVLLPIQTGPVTLPQIPVGGSGQVVNPGVNNLIGAGAAVGEQQAGVLPGPGSNQTSPLGRSDSTSEHRNMVPEASGLAEDAVPLDLGSIEKALQGFLDQLGDFHENLGWVNSIGFWTWMLGTAAITAAMSELIRRRLRTVHQGVQTLALHDPKLFGFLPGADPFMD